MEIDIHKRSLFTILPSLLSKYINNINNISEYLNMENYCNCNNENDISNICNIISSILLYHILEESLIKDKNELLSYSNLIGSILSTNQNYIYISLSLYFIDVKIDYSYGFELLLNNDEIFGIKEKELIILLLKEILIDLSYTYINYINLNGIDAKLIFDVTYEISFNKDNYYDVYIYIIIIFFFIE